MKRAARFERWAASRRVIAAGLEVLSHPQDKFLRARFNQILDGINKQIAAGLTEREIVEDAIARGSRDLRRLQDTTYLPIADLREILDELEEAGRVRWVSKSEVELRDKSRERAAVLRVMRANATEPTTLEDLRDATGYTRRHLAQIIAELQADRKISRTRSGFLVTGSPADRARVEHDDDCLCRRCLTPRSQQPTNGGINAHVDFQ